MLCTCPRRCPVEVCIEVEVDVLVLNVKVDVEVDVDVLTLVDLYVGELVGVDL